MSKKELRRAFDDAEAALLSARRRRSSAEELARLVSERDRAFSARFKAGA